MKLLQTNEGDPKAETATPRTNLNREQSPEKYLLFLYWATKDGQKSRKPSSDLNAKGNIFVDQRWQQYISKLIQ